LHIDDGPRRDRWAIVFLAATLYVPPVRALFGFDVLHAIDIAICIGAAIVGTAWFELLKAVRARRGD